MYRLRCSYFHINVLNNTNNNIIKVYIRTKVFIKAKLYDSFADVALNFRFFGSAYFSHISTSSRERIFVSVRITTASSFKLLPCFCFDLCEVYSCNPWGSRIPGWRSPLHNARCLSQPNVQHSTTLGFRFRMWLWKWEEAYCRAGWGGPRSRTKSTEIQIGK
jgi:hypothetical protein